MPPSNGSSLDKQKYFPSRSMAKVCSKQLLGRKRWRPAPPIFFTSSTFCRCAAWPIAAERFKWCKAPRAASPFCAMARSFMGRRREAAAKERSTKSSTGSMSNLPTIERSGRPSKPLRSRGTHFSWPPSNVTKKTRRARKRDEALRNAPLGVQDFRMPSVTSASRLLRLGLAAVSLLVVSEASAQIQIDIKFRRLQYIAYEPVIVTLGITNLAGRDIEL